MAFKTTLDAALTAAMTDYTGKVVNDVLTRLADKYGFDLQEAQSFLLAGGVVVKYPTLEREKLPWTGDVRDCCKAIKKNGGLFTQCTGSIHSDNWCKPCSKEVAKKGKTTCGTVHDRASVDILEYQVGPIKVKPYIEYMKKHGIPREQVDQACEEYGIVIDPRQFELKKRPRKPREMGVAISTQVPNADDDDNAATTAGDLDEDEQLESDDEYEPPQEPAEPVATEVAPAPSPVAAAAVVVAVTQEPAPSPLTQELQTEPFAPQATITAEQIAAMDKKTVQAHCRARGIDIQGKGVVQLKRELSSSK